MKYNTEIKLNERDKLDRRNDPLSIKRSLADRLIYHLSEQELDHIFNITKRDIHDGSVEYKASITVEHDVINRNQVIMNELHKRDQDLVNLNTLDKPLYGDEWVADKHKKDSKEYDDPRDHPICGDDDWIHDVDMGSR